MSIDTVLDLARQDTGLTDFGHMDFVGRLGMLLAEVESDGNVWKAHKAHLPRTLRQGGDEPAVDRALLER